MIFEYRRCVSVALRRARNVNSGTVLSLAVVTTSQSGKIAQFPAFGVTARHGRYARVDSG